MPRNAGPGGSKDITKSIRLSLQQWRRVKRAAVIESRRTGVRVHPTVLLAELGMDGVDAILAAAEQQPQLAAS